MNKEYIVSVIMIKPMRGMTNVQNILYKIDAVSSDEANGKAIPKAQKDYPEHSFHSVCCWELASQAQQTESKPSIEDVQNLVDASESIMNWLVENVHQWNFKAYDRLHLATMRVKDSIPPAPEGDKE